MPLRSSLAWLALLLAAAPLLAETPPARMTPQTILGLFNSAQELPVLTADQLAARSTLLDDDEAAAADVALNDWKLCVADALTRWSVLKPGVGVLIDGAYGRCADLERQYRDHLMRISPNGRPMVDIQLARGMTRLLEDIWRPRLVAAALDQELARQGPPGTAGLPGASLPHAGPVEGQNGVTLRGGANPGRQSPRTR